MQSSVFSLGESGSDQLFNRRLDPEPPEFDITAMVDLVFMMNIYFLVTFITVAMSELSLPAAKHVAALDPEDYYDFQVNRPRVVLEGGKRRISWRTTRVLVARDTSLGTPQMAAPM